MLHANFFYLCRRMKKLIAFIIRYVPRKYLQLAAGTGLKLLSLLYRGHGVMCPICEKEFRKFLPYGRINPRANALCPSCLSLERHRLIWLYLKDKTDFFTKAHDVLHIAPEVCFIDRFEKLLGSRYITADIESPLAKVKADIHHLPFPDRAFDIVLCNHVLEHVNDDIQAMREIARVLKPGGFAILQVPFYEPMVEETYEDFTITDSKGREKAFGQSDHVRKYGYDYPKRVEKAGLQPVQDDFVMHFSAEDAFKFGLPRTELLNIARKGG